MIFIVAFLAFVVVCFAIMLITEYFYSQENDKLVGGSIANLLIDNTEMENKPKCEINKNLPCFIHDPENEMIDHDKRFLAVERSIFMVKMRDKAIEDEFNNDCA